MKPEQWQKEETRPDVKVPAVLCRPLRAKCDLGDACPAEHALFELFEETQRREFGDQQSATNIDRLANAYTKAALAIEQSARDFDELKREMASLRREVRGLKHVKWWIAGIVAGFEVVRTLGLGPLLKGLLQ